MQAISNSYNKAAEKVCKVLGYVTGAWFFVLLVALSYQVAARFVLNSSASWTEELASYSLVWIVMLGIAIGVHEVALPKVEVLVVYLPQKVQIVLEIIVGLLCCIFFYVMITSGISMAHKMLPQRISSLGISVTWCYLSIPVGGVFDAFFTIEHILRNLIRLSESEDTPKLPGSSTTKGDVGK